MAKDGPKTGRPGYTEPGRSGVKRTYSFCAAGLASNRARLNGALQSVYVEGRPTGAAAAFGAASLAFGGEGQPYAPAQVEGSSSKKGDDNEQLNVHNQAKTRGTARKFAAG